MQCPYCKEDIKEEAIKCKHCGSNLKDSSVEVNENAKEEVVLFDEDGVKITNHQFVTKEQPYLLDKINSVNMKENSLNILSSKRHKSLFNKIIGIVLVFFGGLLSVIAILILNSKGEIPGVDSNFIYIVIMMMFIIFLFAIKLLRAPKYSVTLTRGMERTDALNSDNAEYIQKIVDILNKAMVSGK